ncbi:MAG: glycosyltransferase family 2 protein [Planctomycetia bacterium]
MAFHVGEILRTPDQCPPGEKLIAVLPAYNAARTLERTLRDIPPGKVDEILLVDDGSRDGTPDLARSMGLTVIVHTKNRGYGGNQKTCYRYALDQGADYIVMIHPDYQYDSRVMDLAIGFLRLGICDVILGSRIRTRREALAGGMPLAKYIANRGLTFLENVGLGQNLGDFHSGFRAYRRSVLEMVPFERNSESFVFDSQFLVQSVYFGFRLGDIPVPVRYFDEASSISMYKSSIYAVRTLWVVAQYWAKLLGLSRNRLFDPVEPAPPIPLPKAADRAEEAAPPAG